MTDRETLKFRKRLLAQLAALPVTKTVERWRHLATCAIGGLNAVGFGPESDHLLVLSMQGSGVFDATTGERVAREPSAVDFDQVACVAPGVGPLEGSDVSIAGLFGGGLARRTSDGWALAVFDLDPLTPSVFLEPPGASVLDESFRKGCVRLGLEPWGQIHAVGFSPTGRSFVVADSAGVELFTR